MEETVPIGSPSIIEKSTNEDTIKSERETSETARNRSIPQEIENNFVDLVTELRTEMNEKLHFLHQEMLFTVEEQAMRIISQTVKTSIRQQNMLEDINLNLDLLNQTDHFVTAFYKMSEENQRLKDEIAALKRNQ